MIVYRYLLEELYTVVLAMILILLMILMSNQLVHYMKMAADGVIAISTIIQVILLQIPSYIAYLMPLVFYLSVLLGLSRLYADSEMVVLHACGLSRFRLAAMVMTFAFVMALVLSYMMFALDARLHQAYLNVIHRAAVQVSLSKVVKQRFQALPNGGGTIYAGDTDQAHRLYHVFFAQHQANSWTLLVAKRAYAKQMNGRSFLVFDQGHRYVGYPGLLTFKQMDFKRYALDVSFTNNNLANQQSIEKQAADWHWRMAMPISLMVLSLYGISLGRVDRRKSRFANLFPALLVYLVYINVLYLGRGWLRSGVISLHWGLWWAHAMMLGFWMLYVSLFLRQQVR